MQERRGSKLIGDLVAAIEPAGGKIWRVLKEADLLRAMRDGKSQANKKPAQHGCMGSVWMAEEVGFEPTDGRPSPVFKTGAFSRSATPPQQCGEYYHADPACKSLPGSIAG